MSLQVWLPLNGDLHNQGLHKYPITIFRGTETYNNQGKIGKCFYSNGVNTIKILDIIPDFQTYISYSLCAWFYIETNNTTHSGSAIISAGDWNSQVLNLSLSDWSIDHYTRLRVSGTNWNNWYNYNFNKNTWYHVVVCSDGNKTYAYVNGNLIGDTIAGFLPSSISGHDLCIGGATYYGGMQFFGKINDARIYNHCLSAKEVEEISKGLILHYKLNNNGLGNPNLVKGNYSAITTATTNNISGTLSFDTSIIALNDLKGKTLYFSYDYSVEGAKLYNNTGDYTKDRYGIHGNLSYVDSSGTTKTTYPFAGYLTASGTGRAIQSYIIPADAKQINSLTFGLQPFNKPAANSTATWYIKNCKLEIGQSTSYTPNQNDIHQNSSIIYDFSGYNNNGQIIGSLETIVPSPRYDCATHIPATSSKIHISNFLTSGFSNSYSFAWWGKRDSNNPMFWGFSDGIRLNGMYLGNLWNTGDGSNNPLYKIGTTTQVSVPSVNVWHHYVMVGNGSKCYVYLDGELWAEAKTYKAISGTSIYINGWDTGTSYCSNNTDMSDFRIYATALTEAQVKELYRTSMNIDGTNILPRDLE